MKKKISLLIMASIILGLVACSSPKSETSTEIAANETSAGKENRGANTDDIKAAWPIGDVKIVVPNAAGGSSDMAARLFAGYVSKESGKNVVVVNETGGSNTVGFETVRNAKPDGSTLLSFHSSALLNYFSGKISYSIMDESAYTFVNFIYEPMETSVNCIAVSAASPYMTMEDLLDAARSNPGTITCGDGYGSSAAVTCGQIELAANVKFKHVDAPDTTARITSIIGGQIDWAPIGYANAQPYVESGDIRLLAMDGTVDFDENVPTLESLGYKGIAFPTYGFIAGPADMDQAVIDSIDAWCQEFCASNAENMEKLGFTTKVWTREEALAQEKELADSTQKTTEALGW